MGEPVSERPDRSGEGKPEGAAAPRIEPGGAGVPEKPAPEKPAKAEPEKARTEIAAGDVADDLADFA